jgi:hypothetical protein
LKRAAWQWRMRGLSLDAGGLLRHLPVMDSDERDIFNYLKTWGAEFVSVKEICRRAGTKRRFHENPDWARPLLLVMTERSILERDLLGRYRLKPKPRRDGGRWISPEIEKILREKGVDVESNATNQLEDDEHYEQL